MKFRLPKGLPQRRHKVKEATATRAIYAAGADELHTIALTFTLVDGNKIEVELNLVEAGKFISQMRASYNAALPKHHSNIH